MLYIVSTPIGNLEDISFRGIKILKEVDLILAEDTRQTIKVLKKHDISNKLISYNDNNKERKTPKFIKLLNEGKNLALVSDCGTPCINDPGFYIVRECIRNDIEISPVPGPSSILAALVASGLPTDKFSFLGFIPKKGRENFLKRINDREETVILFESPHRIKKTISLMNNVFPKKQIVIARELTKKFEEYIRGSVSEVNDMIKDRTVKGEIVLILK